MLPSTVTDASIELVLKALQHEGRLRGTSDAKYPEPFKNKELLPLNWIGSPEETVYEFPIFPDRPAEIWAPRMDPGRHRVIYRANKLNQYFVIFHHEAVLTPTGTPGFLLAIHQVGAQSRNQLPSRPPSLDNLDAFPRLSSSK